MSDLSLDFSRPSVGTNAYRDLIIQGGDLVLTSDVSNVPVATNPTLQLIASRLLHFLGEYFLDTSEGTGWLQVVARKGVSKQDVDALIQDRILGTPGVGILTAYQSQAYPAQRLYRISFSVITTAGVTISNTVPVNLGLGA